MREWDIEKSYGDIRKESDAIEPSAGIQHQFLPADCNVKMDQCLASLTQEVAQGYG